MLRRPRVCLRYQKAAQQFANEGSPLKLAKVDCIAQTQLQQEYDIQGFPKLMLFRTEGGGEAGEAASTTITLEYTGERDYYSISRYMRDAAMLGSTQLTEPKEAQALLRDKSLHAFVRYDSVVVAAAFEPDQMVNGDAVWDTYRALLNRARADFIFVHTADEAVVSKLGLTRGAMTVLVTPHLRSGVPSKDATVLQLPADKSKSSQLHRSLRLAGLPLVGVLTTKNYELYTKPLVVLYTAVDYSSAFTSKAAEFWRQKLLVVAKKFADTKTVAFTIADAEKNNAGVAAFGLQEMEEAAVAMYDAHDNKFRIPLGDDVSAKSIEAFVTKSLAPGAAPYLKSAKPPKKKEQKREGALKIIVGSTFKQLVLDESKHALVEFYAPWCGHCKALMPTFKALATMLKGAGVKDVLVGKFDATANDAPPEYKVPGYPTIYLTPAGRGAAAAPIKFDEQARTEMDLLRFLYKHTHAKSLEPLMPVEHEIKPLAQAAADGDVMHDAVH